MANIAPDGGFVVAIDQGTSSTKAIAVNASGQVVARASRAISQSHPAPGWVEQDANEIAQSALEVLGDLADQLDADFDGGASLVRGIGLSTQRESALLWDTTTGQPLGPVLGWQDRRTKDRAAELVEQGHAERVRELSGLPIDPMFSALKLEWLLDEVDPDRSHSARGEIAAGTVDAWLVFVLTGEHRIEAGNASRTQLLELATATWSTELAELFRVPLAVLPQVVASDAPSALLTIKHRFSADARVTAVLADSHAALYGHGARVPGTVKVTYGTGSSIMGLRASDQQAPSGLVDTIAWSIDGVAYAYEGNILSTGATLVWLGDILGITPAELADLAEAATPDSGVNLVPAFAGLGAPWWDENAQGAISGLTLGTDRGTLARAAIESVVLQIEDVLSAVDAESAAPVTEVYVDGGPTANPWLMQLQADLSQRNIIRSDVAELSALGAAKLAAVGCGLWVSDSHLDQAHTAFRPQQDEDTAARRREAWLGAVARTRFIPAPGHDASKNHSNA